MLEDCNDIVGCLALNLNVATVAKHLDDEANSHVVLIFEALPRRRPTFIGWARNTHHDVLVSQEIWLKFGRPLKLL